METLNFFFFRKQGYSERWCVQTAGNISFWGFHIVYTDEYIYVCVALYIKRKQFQSKMLTSGKSKCSGPLKIWDLMILLKIAAETKTAIFLLSLSHNPAPKTSMGLCSLHIIAEAAWHFQPEHFALPAMLCVFFLLFFAIMNLSLSLWPAHFC